MYTVGKLITELQKYDKDRVVILSKDEEGNGFGALYRVEPYTWNSKWEEIGIESLTDKLKEWGYTEEDVIPGVPAIVLWP